eukprot:CAMPEP_0175054778 /NCGR_PEP_ID=MMETSP0052_2-20121109/9693_1 /TAXON_ID=51329 ORGANISM="Polytomella parva, Strain SAG 63-3" /NCGR_SAMPLE_ID=MMETSP0052_2 /ASSEMBLY_ACC=CAM_ASM_000194 /LENGTH=59 /DNA_ID=CAMNT_0016319509 /DNA_START=76 /DNA_END=251 /DNA_ORIENTATION=+
MSHPNNDESKGKGVRSGLANKAVLNNAVHSSGTVIRNGRGGVGSSSNSSSNGGGGGGGG